MFDSKGESHLCLFFCFFSSQKRTAIQRLHEMDPKKKIKNQINDKTILIRLTFPVHTDAGNLGSVKQKKKKKKKCARA